MTNIPKYPVDIQSFSVMRNDGYLYVDKTDLIYHLANNHYYVFLSRPRRFGKTLLMSTLEAYFKGEKELFAGLAMEHLEKDWISYPVLRFDLSAENFKDLSRVISHLEWLLSRIERRYGMTGSGTISQRLSDVIEHVHEQTGRKVVVLIDEYDKPMLDTLHNDEMQEEVKNELRAFYSVLKSSYEHVRFVMLTGVTKFGKVSIFSGLNNLTDISMVREYDSICGITQAEFDRYFTHSVVHFAGHNNLTVDEAKAKFKDFYDGYHFAIPGAEIYNPFSVFYAFRFNSLDQYWFASGSSTFLVKLLMRHPYRLNELDKAQRTGAELSDITELSGDIVPLLYQSGYLTLRDYDAESGEYTLGFPNQEVYKAFWSSLAKHLFASTENVNGYGLKGMTEDLMKGDADAFLLKVKSLFGSVSSEYEAVKEVHFQNMMAVIARMLGFTVRTEVHSSAGRCDMTIFTPSYIYLFEYKVDKAPKTALEQIYDKAYYLPYLADGRTMFAIGVEFSTRTRAISRWTIEEISKDKS